jgi:hypothetical protein
MGCQASHVSDSLVASTGGSDLDSQFEFWHRLPDRPVTCNDEAFHGLLLCLDHGDSAADYGARVQALESRGLLAEHFTQPADAPLRRGDLAVAVAGILHIRGGAMMHLMPRSPRYALLELEDRGLFPPSGENESLTGAEFLGIIGRMKDYQSGEENPLPASAFSASAQAAP